MEVTHSATTWILLVSGGALTLCPLALFAVAAPRVSLSTIGILQYIGPTLQWICGAVVLSEPVSGTKFLGFGFVWAGVLVFIASGLRQPKASPKPELIRSSILDDLSD
jgi:chloramphenicol-sensitive protein RarD